MSQHHPQLRRFALDALKPTQMTVGMREVQSKSQQWKSLARRQRQAALEAQCFPAVLGPGGRPYIVDHHHLGLALSLADQPMVWVNLIRDFSWLEVDEFWRAMEFYKWAHPYDKKGLRRSFDEMPGALADLVDDPYRSLAGALRHAGGYAKDATPFAEFLWADYLRRRIPKKQLTAEFDEALRQARTLAALPVARFLPGWAGDAGD